MMVKQKKLDAFFFFWPLIWSCLFGHAFYGMWMNMKMAKEERMLLEVAK